MSFGVFPEPLANEAGDALASLSNAVVGKLKAQGKHREPRKTGVTGTEAQHIKPLIIPNDFSIEPINDLKQAVERLRKAAKEVAEEISRKAAEITREREAADERLRMREVAESLMTGISSARNRSDDTSYNTIHTSGDAVARPALRRYFVFMYYLSRPATSTQ